MKNKEELEKKTGVKCISSIDGIKCISSIDGIKCISSIDGIKCISSIDGIKRFSFCVMNPPYSKTLHLKFLEKVIEFTDKVISIQPCGWLLDTTAALGMKKNTSYKKFEDSISKHIRNLEILNADEANKSFAIGGFESVGIYECDKENYDTYKSLHWNNKIKSIFDKIILTDKGVKLSSFGNISTIHGHPGQDDEFDICTPQYGLMKKWLKDLNDEQIHNYVDNCHLYLLKYANFLTRQGQHVHPEMIRVPKDFIDRKYSDDEMYDYFDLNEEEINQINKKMSRHINWWERSKKKKEELEKKTGVKCISSIDGIKRFSVCVMNPPYDKSLHLKFLENIIKVTDNVVTVQPVRWIEETVGPKKKTSAFNKYEDSIAKHIKELDIYSAEEAEKLFGAAFNFNIGIYVCDKEGGFDYSKLNTNKILDKVLEKMPDNIDNHIKFNEPNTAIIVSLITGGNNGRNNVIDLYFQGSTYKSVIYDGNSKRLDNGLTFYENRKKTAWGNVKVRGEQFNIKFKNIDECINFFNSTRTYLFRYIFNVVTSDVHVQTKFLPFMNDYSKPWTDERMYDYFNITKEEQKEIEERVDKIYNEIQQRIEEINKILNR